jgi:hypothetical protein
MKNEKSKELPVRYCSYCGEKIIVNMMSTDKEKYNRKTGERQYRPYFKCPNYRQKKWYLIFGSPHSKYFLDEMWIEKSFGVWEKVNNKQNY